MSHILASNTECSEKYLQYVNVSQMNGAKCDQMLKVSLFSVNKLTRHCDGERVGDRYPHRMKGFRNWGTSSCAESRASFSLVDLISFFPIFLKNKTDKVYQQNLSWSNGQFILRFKRESVRRCNKLIRKSE